MANDIKFRTVLHLRNLRVRFCDLWQPRVSQKYPNTKPKFEVTLLMAKDHPQVGEVRAAISGIMRQHWGAALDNPAFLSTIDVAFRDGAMKFDAQGNPSPGFGPDVWYMNAKSPSRVPVVDANRAPLVESDGRPYPGCYVNAFISFYTSTDYDKKSVNTGLEGIQFFRDGDEFAGGGARVNPSMFDDVTGVAPSAVPLQTGNAASFLM